MRAEPNLYVYRLLFQAQICGASYPVNLSLERQTTRFSVSGQSMPFLKFIERMVLCLKSSTPSAADSMYIVTSFMPVSQQPKTESQPTKTIASRPLQKVFGCCCYGICRIIAMMFAWKAPESIGFLSTTSLNWTCFGTPQVCQSNKVKFTMFLCHRYSRRGRG